MFGREKRGLVSERSIKNTTKLPNTFKNKFSNTGNSKQRPILNNKIKGNSNLKKELGKIQGNFKKDKEKLDKLLDSEEKSDLSKYFKLYSIFYRYKNTYCNTIKNATDCSGFFRAFNRCFAGINIDTECSNSKSLEEKYRKEDFVGYNSGDNKDKYLILDTIKDNLIELADTLYKLEEKIIEECERGDKFLNGCNTYFDKLYNSFYNNFYRNIILKNDKDKHLIVRYWFSDRYLSLIKDFNVPSNSALIFDAKDCPNNNINDKNSKGFNDRYSLYNIFLGKPNYFMNLFNVELLLNETSLENSKSLASLENSKSLAYRGYEQLLQFTENKKYKPLPNNEKENEVYKKPSKIEDFRVALKDFREVYSPLTDEQKNFGSFITFPNYYTDAESRPVLSTGGNKKNKTTIKSYPIHKEHTILTPSLNLYYTQQMYIKLFLDIVKKNPGITFKKSYTFTKPEDAIDTLKGLVKDYKKQNPQTVNDNEEEGELQYIKRIVDGHYNIYMYGKSIKLKTKKIKKNKEVKIDTSKIQFVIKNKGDIINKNVYTFELQLKESLSHITIGDETGHFHFTLNFCQDIMDSINNRKIFFPLGGEYDISDNELIDLNKIYNNKNNLNNLNKDFLKEEEMDEINSIFDLSQITEGPKKEEPKKEQPKKEELKEEDKNLLEIDKLENFNFEGERKNNNILQVDKVNDMAIKNQENKEKENEGDPNRLHPVDQTQINEIFKGIKEIKEENKNLSNNIEEINRILPNNSNNNNIQELSNELKKYNESIEQLKVDIGRLKEEVDKNNGNQALAQELKDKVEELEKLQKEYNNKIDEFKKDLENVNKLSDKFDGLQKQNKEALDKIEGLRPKIESIESSNKVLANKIEGLGSKFDGIKKEVEDKIGELSGKLKEVEANNNTNKNQILAKITSLTEQLEAIDKNKGGDNEGIKENQEKLFGEIQELGQQIGQFRQENGDNLINLWSEINGLKEAFSHAINELKVGNNDNNNQELLKILKESFEGELKGLHEKLKEVIEDNKKTKELIGEKLNGIHLFIESQKSTNDRLIKGIDDLKQSLNNNKEELNNKIQKLNENDAQLLSLINGLDKKMDYNENLFSEKIKNLKESLEKNQNSLSEEIKHSKELLKENQNSLLKDIGYLKESLERKQDNNQNLLSEKIGNLEKKHDESIKNLNDRITELKNGKNDENLFKIVSSMFNKDSNNTNLNDNILTKLSEVLAEEKQNKEKLDALKEKIEKIKDQKYDSINPIEKLPHSIAYQPQLYPQPYQYLQPQSQILQSQIPQPQPLQSQQPQPQIPQSQQPTLNQKDNNSNDKKEFSPIESEDTTNSSTRSIRNGPDIFNCFASMTINGNEIRERYDNSETNKNFKDICKLWTDAMNEIVNRPEYAKFNSNIFNRYKREFKESCENNFEKHEAKVSDDYNDKIRTLNIPKLFNEFYTKNILSLKENSENSNSVKYEKLKECMDTKSVVVSVRTIKEKTVVQPIDCNYNTSPADYSVILKYKKAGIDIKCEYNSSGNVEIYYKSNGTDQEWSNVGYVANNEFILKDTKLKDSKDLKDSKVLKIIENLHIEQPIRYNCQLKEETIEKDKNKENSNMDNPTVSEKEKQMEKTTGSPFMNTHNPENEYRLFKSKIKNLPKEEVEEKDEEEDEKKVKNDDELEEKSVVKEDDKNHDSESDSIISNNSESKIEDRKEINNNTINKNLKRNNSDNNNSENPVEQNIDDKDAKKNEVNNQDKPAFSSKMKSNNSIRPLLIKRKSEESKKKTISRSITN